MNVKIIVEKRTVLSEGHTSTTQEQHAKLEYLYICFCFVTKSYTYAERGELVAILKGSPLFAP